MNVKYVGPVYDPSGHAEFARGLVKALHAAGENVWLEPNSFDTQKPNIGEDSVLFKELSSNKNTPSVKILNMTPDFFHRWREPNMKNVGFTMFETSRIPDLWVTECNKMDAIFVPCEWNKTVFEESGVKVPVYAIQPGVNPLPEEALRKTISMSSIKESDFVFYSIFQWTERKNPAGLLRAYWSEFYKDDNVVLVIKSYRSNTSQEEQARLKQEIQLLKNDLRLPKYPKIVFVGNLLSNEEMKNIHLNGDCFVLPHRAEGWGMPHMEAMRHGRPVISTAFSGNMDFMNEENSLLVPCQMTPVRGMSWICWYEGDMYWGEPDIKALREKMRWAYTNRGELKKIAAAGKKTIDEDFNWKVRVSKMVKALKEIIGD